MSLRKLANSLSRPKDRNRGTSNSSTASWSPSNSRSHTPLSSTVSLPDTVSAVDQQRNSSSSLPSQSHQSIGYAHGPNPTPLRIVAPFVYNAPPESYESTSSLGSNETADSETKTLRLKRSLNKLISPKEQDFSHDYHYQKQADSRKNKDHKRSRKGSMSGESTSDKSTFLDENRNSTASFGNSSGGTTKRFVSWMSQRQSGVAKKVNDVLRRDGGSSNGGPMPPARQPPMSGRMSGEYREEDDDRSSISSAQSFVQMVPEDEVSRILSEPDIIPSLTMNQAPFQIPPAVVYVPRSHTNLHALTLTSLAFPPSPHPLLYNPSLPAFPRSSNASSKLPRLPTFRAHLAKTRILDRLEAQNLTQSENESILPFGRRDDLMQKENGSGNPKEENEEGRKITDHPGQSLGLETWTRRPSFLQRIRVWQHHGTRPTVGDGEGIRYEAVSSSTIYKTELKISKGIKALAGLVPARPESRELPELPLSAVGASITGVPTLPVPESLSPQSLGSSLMIDESMLMDRPDISPSPTHSLTLIGVPPMMPSLSSPRPLPTVPVVRSPETPLSPNPSQIIHGGLIDDHSPVIPIRPLPPVPRPLPIPPAVTVPTVTTEISVNEVESIDGPAITATMIYQEENTPPYQTQHLSPPSSTHGHTIHSHVGIPSSSTITSAPHTPLDPLDTESTRRLSIGSISVVMTGPSGFSLEEMDGLEVTSPHDFDKRRSVASLKLNVQKRLSMASRASRASSPSLRNHPLPPLSESSRYSESSYLSSRHTPTGSAATSVEKLHRQFSPSLSSLPFEPEAIEDEPVPPLPIMESIGREETQPPFEPSRKSEENLDPFLFPRLSAVGVPTSDGGKNHRVSANGVKALVHPSEGIWTSVPQLDESRLSLRTDVSTPTGPRFEKKSPLVTSARPSPTGSSQSPTGSEYLEADGSRGLGVKVVKLKRSGSQMSNDGSLGGNGAGRSLQRTLKDPSKFWPHNRRVDEKTEEEVLEGELENGIENDVERTKTASWSAERDSMLDQSTPLGVESQSTSDLSSADATPHLRTSGVFTPLDDVPESAVTVKGILPLTSDDQSLSSLPLSVALDVARLSDTSNLDLTLFSFRSSPSSKSGDLPRNSVSSSGRSDSDSLSRSASMREMAANMPLLPTPSGTRLASNIHGRTPSSERAARIEAHLDSVSSTRFRPTGQPQSRPDFLPYPGSRNRQQHSIDRHDSARASMSSRLSQDDESQLDQEELSESAPSSPPPNGSFGSRAPPSRWGTSDWKTRQRQLHTLPLPSASIAPSAVRPVPLGRALNRTGSIMSPSTSSISRQTHSQLGTYQGRPLRM
ncbi:hypothetical protein FRC16_009810 [Serendipita sp. 398]|nr:hypothetical protein FRC16_009810 [Serendipita sp. 398]